MDGVFMRKFGKRLAAIMLILSLFWFGTVLSDRQALNNGLIRLHVVANSDSDTDQAAKRAVRDAVLAVLDAPLERIPDAGQAEGLLRDNMPRLEKAASDALAALGSTDQVTVSLGKERFDTRLYDTFSLPAGTYESLKITIGAGKGKNWWCVVYPSLCIAAGREFYDVAASAGFPKSLSGALTGEGNYTLRFFLLDLLGKLENRFGKG